LERAFENYRGLKIKNLIQVLNSQPRESGFVYLTA